MTAVIVPAALACSTVVRAAAAIWAFVLLWRLRDWRLGFLASMITLMAVRQASSLSGYLALPSGELVALGGTAELPGLAVSVMALLSVAFLQRVITERRCATSALRHRDAWFAMLVEQIPAHLWTTDRDLRVTSLTGGGLRALGLREGDLIGRRMQEYFGTEALDYLPIRAQRRAIEGETVTYDHQWLGDDFQVYVAPIYDERHSICGSIGMGLNITEHKRAEAARLNSERELRQAQKLEALGTLAGGIAHDFNNLLAAVRGYAQLASVELDVGTPAKDHLSQVLVASNRATRLVDQILSFSRSDHDRRVPVRVREIVDEALSLLRASSTPTICTRTTVDCSNDTVDGDPTQLHQVVMNLCSNAAHAIGENSGIIEVTLESYLPSPAESGHGSGRRWLRLSVADTGSGIPAAIVERIFEPFFTTKPTHLGAGMGLAVVHGIVRAHGGTVRMAHTSAAGTRFEVCLPLREGPADFQAQDSEATTDGARERVMAADDVPVPARSMRQDDESRPRLEGRQDGTSIGH